MAPRERQRQMGQQPVVVIISTGEVDRMVALDSPQSRRNEHLWNDWPLDAWNEVGLIDRMCWTGSLTAVAAQTEIASQAKNLQFRCK